MKQLAAFASSDAGKAFARVEQHFGRDPARFLEDTDDVLAHNLRAAFVVTMSEPEAEEGPGERARAAAQRFREEIDA